VFRREAGQAWNHAGYVKAVNTGDSDYFGASVAFSGDGTTLAVGAFNEEGPGVGLNANPNEDGASLAGAVYVVQ
jgi:FG-GAP repeat